MNTLTTARRISSWSCSQIRHQSSHSCSAENSFGSGEYIILLESFPCMENNSFFCARENETDN